MPNSTEWPLTTRAYSILSPQIAMLPWTDVESRLVRYRELCSTWNPAAKLMGRPDIEHRFDEHVADSLSLAVYLHEYTNRGSEWIDIGSGGGLPALPVSIALSSAPSVALIERSQTKSDFLRFTLRELDLKGISVHQTEFRNTKAARGPTIYTARAVERPLRLLSDLCARMAPRDVYLRQTGNSPDEPPTGLRQERALDEFDQAGLRRGRLYIVDKTPSPA